VGAVGRVKLAVRVEKKKNWCYQTQCGNIHGPSLASPLGGSKGLKKIYLERF